MSDNNEEIATVVAKLLLAIVVGFVVRPLAVIYGVNLLLSSVAITTLPYTLSVYFGVLVIVLAISVRIADRES